MAKHYDSIAAPEGRGKPTSGSTAAWVGRRSARPPGVANY